ncbi:diacylglycerol/lipid kinase family protein [Paenibacillus sp. NPDC058071]|uniref:diacylglycerol/lipid kinase family protein n=1 Tax=Paenibacillus sp. NPDC058071 TaxID=3346326 RepID=UPI0036D773AD
MLLFAVNPSAGNGRGKRAWSIVEAELNRRSIAYEAIILNNMENAYKEMSDRLEKLGPQGTGKLDAIAVIGGDGTLHGLLPLFVGSGVPVGIIPAGSGNDTARHFRIPHKPLAALRKLLDGRAVPIDLIRTKLKLPSASSQADQDELQRPSFTITAVAAGFDSAIAAAVDRSFYKSWCNRLGIGSFAYVIGVLQTLFAYRPTAIEVTIDGVMQRFERSWLSAIASTSSYGGGLRICPEANAADGKLDICIVHSCSTLQLLFLLPTLLLGAHTKLRYVTMLQGASVRLRPVPVKSGKGEASLNHPIEAYGDGERLGEVPLESVVLPSSLRFISG